jgi:MATE family multidrug resistance protein
MLAAAFGYWGVGFPTAYVLAFHFELGPKGLWWGLAAGLASVAVLMTLRFHRISRRFVETGVAPKPDDADAANPAPHGHA